MTNAAWAPDIIVGIDFGMTCTGVAWSMGPDWPHPKTLQHWPGKLGHEIRNKVDTAISYHVRTGELANWGFLCNPDDVNHEHNELFKLHLDPHYQDITGTGPSLEEARVWFRDYMGCLRKCIIQQFEKSIARFDAKRVEYLFSVPTTWRDPGQLAAIENLIRQAGYAQLNKERISIYLTEAEAAAVYTSRQSMEKGDVFLVCDAGGGTTDLNIMKVELASKENLELTPLGWTEGRAAGSALIDYKIQTLIAGRLGRIRSHVAGDLDTIASSMMGDSFTAFKCSFGSESGSASRLLLPVPGMRQGMSFSDAGVEDSSLILHSEELRVLFDEQVARITNLIDEQLERLQSNHPGVLVDYLVMSGGLGTSEYVRTQIQKRYETARVPACARTMKLLSADEPQLAVVHGLVLARSQARRGGRDIYSQRCCPVSYGIVCRQRYDPQIHANEDVVRDPYGKDHWAEGQITWIIRQGDIVEAEQGVRQKYRMKLGKGHEYGLQVVNIVMSTLPPDRLPRSMKHPGARSVCDVEFELSAQDMKTTKRKWYKPSEVYNEAEFDVRLLVGTGLTFEVWNGHGLRSKSHEEIAVQWLSPDAMQTARSSRRSEVYRA